MKICCTVNSKYKDTYSRSHQLLLFPRTLLTRDNAYASLIYSICSLYMETTKDTGNVHGDEK
jgi:hypothetical protein